MMMKDPSVFFPMTACTSNVVGLPISDAEDDALPLENESVETDLDLKLHVMGSKSLWTQNLFCVNEQSSLKKWNSCVHMQARAKT